MTSAERVAAAGQKIAARSGEETLARLLEAACRILDDADGGVHEILVTTHHGRITDVHRRRPKERVP